MSDLESQLNEASKIRLGRLRRLVKAAEMYESFLSNVEQKLATENPEELRHIQNVLEMSESYHRVIVYYDE